MADDRYDKVRIKLYNGRYGVTDKYSVAVKEAMEEELGYALSVVQAGYNNDVAASAGTHGGGGVFDFLDWDATHKVLAGRGIGHSATWRRTIGQGFTGNHVHLAMIGHKFSKALYQVAAWIAGFNGLGRGGRGGRDTGWRPKKFTPFDYQAWVTKKAAPKPATFYVIVDRAFAHSTPKASTKNVVGSLAFGKKLLIRKTKRVYGTLWGATIVDGKDRWWIIDRHLSKTKPTIPTLPKVPARCRIMSFNIADKLPGDRVAAIVADIVDGNPWIVGIQEGGGRLGPNVPSALVARLLTALGKNWGVVVPTTDFNENYFLYAKSKAGVANRLDDVILRVPDAAGKHLSRTVFTLLDSDTDVLIGNHHLEHQGGTDWDEVRQAQGAQSATGMTAGASAYGIPVTRCVNLGDDNTHQPINAFTPLGLLDAAGLTDNVVNIELATFSGLSTTPGTSDKNDLDHIRVHKDVHVNGFRLVARLKAGKYVTPKASDHQPVVADITFKE